MAKTPVRKPMGKPASRPSLGEATQKFEAGRARELADFQGKLARGKAAIKTARAKLK